MKDECLCRQTLLRKRISFLIKTVVQCFGLMWHVEITLKTNERNYLYVISRILSIGKEYNNF